VPKSGPGPAPRTEAEQNQQIQGTDVSIYFGNVGKSPTLRAQIVVKELLESLHTAADMSATINQLRELCPDQPSKEPLKTTEIGFLYNEAVDSFFSSKPDAYVRHLDVTGTKGSYIVGCMRYETAGETHHTAFCFTQEAGVIDRCRGSESGYFGNYAD
jgi:hypothetical protein